MKIRKRRPRTNCNQNPFIHIWEAFRKGKVIAWAFSRGELKAKLKAMGET